jgi:hypothetical protein
MTRADNAPPKKPKRKDLEKHIEKQNKTILFQHAAIMQLQEQLYWGDLLKNPCHEPDRLIWLEEENSK